MLKKLVITIVILGAICGLGYLASRARTGRIEQPQEKIVLEEPVSEPKQKIVQDVSLEGLAKCLKEKGAKFYGAFWCGWCIRQKELFGEAAKYLPYVECSDKETNQITPECEKAGITGFPTWEINEEKITGFKSLEELAKLSGCPLK